MQDIEQNMDELFRKAADGYPLKTGDSNWDKIAPALLNSPVTPAVKNKKTSRKKYTGLLLLLLSLLIAGGIFIKYSGNKNEIAGSGQSLEKKEAIIPVKETTPFYKKQNTKKESAIEINYSPNQDQQQVNNASVSLHKNKSVNNFVNKPVNKNRVNSQSSSIIEVYQTSPAVMTITKKVTGNDAIRQDDPVNTIDKPVSVVNATHKNDTSNQKESIVVPKNSSVKNPASLQNRRGIYLGVFAGPAFSQVKNQGLEKPGFDIGIIAGYQFNNKMSVETGLLFARKKYFSDGKYFSMSKAGSSMPAGMEVLSLEGSSSVFEIPVKFKYNMFNKNKTSIFSSAGITSYVVTNEKNNYLTLLNGSQQNITSSYKNSSRYFAAAFDFSLGYEKSIGKSVSIRIEPYLQIPLKGIGVGSMPVMSSGLRIGLSKFIH